MSNLTKPKDSLFFTWVQMHGSLGDLDPGYPVDYYGTEPNRLGKLLIKCGVSLHSLFMVERSFERNFTKGDFLVLLGCVLTILLSKIGMHLEYTNQHVELVGVFLGAMILATGICTLRLMVIIREWNQS